MKTLDSHTVDASQFLGIVPEKNSCTVMAFSIATKIPYNQSYEILKNFGRRAKKGIVFENFVKSQFNDFGYVLSKERTTPAQFIKEHPVGSFVLRVKKHVFAVVDGKIYNNGPIQPKKRVDYFVEFFV